jgi:predicted GTPase
VCRKKARKGQCAPSLKPQVLEEAINRIPCDVVLIATPVDLGRFITIKQPTCRLTYRVEEVGPLGFRDVMPGITLIAKMDESFSRWLSLR